MVATQDVIDASTEPDDDVRPPRADSYNRFLNWLGIAIVAVCCIYIFIELQPRLLFLNTTPTGGDTGAHVWFPAYLRDHLLPWRVAGWSDASYAGFPAGQFYFPFPALLIVLLDTVLPYNIAFKLVTALGPVALPIGAYVFGRGIRVPRPAPALFAVGATAFLFFKDGGDATMRYDHHIMGGTLTNTLAGEYSFTIAVACALLFLGTLAMALETRHRLWIPALFLAATLTSHLVVGVFAFVAAVVIWLCSRPLKNTGRAVAIGAVGVALTAVWLVPLAATLKYTTDMRYEPVGTGYTDPWLLGRFGISLPTSFDWLFLSEMWFLFLFALVAIGAGIAYRRRSTLIVGAITLLAGTVFLGWELLRDILGKAPAWNLRLLPFWYLMLYLLAALGAAEIARWAGQFFAWVVHGADRDDDGAEPLDAKLAGNRSSPGDAAPRHRTGRRIVHDGRAREDQRDQGLRHVLGQVQLHRLRRWYSRRRHGEGLHGVSSVHRHRRGAASRAHVVGAELDDRPVRHAARADDAAVLDRRAHQLHGGSLLRVLGHDALPLPRRGHAHARRRRTRCAGCRTARRPTSTSVCGTSNCSASATTRRCPTCSSWRRATPRSAKLRPSPTSTWAPRSAGRSTRWPTRPSSHHCSTNRSSRATSNPTTTGSAKGSRSRPRTRPAGRS